MGVLREGFAASILREIIRRGASLAEKRPFLDRVTGSCAPPEVVVAVGELTRRHGDDDDDVLAATLCAILTHLWRGHAAVYGRDLSGIFSDWRSALNKEIGDFSVTPEAMLDRLSRADRYVCSDLSKADGALLYYDGGHDVYATPRMARMRRRISEILSNWMSCKAQHIRITKKKISENASYRVGGKVFEPHAAQVDAVSSFCRDRLTVVAGGPGTGKTSMVVCQILRIAFEVCKMEPQEILLTAPTGKAAQRMTEAIAQAAERLEDDALREKFKRLEAQTLHRVLSLQKGKLSPYACGEKLSARLVVVDEVSMVELPLAMTMFEAIDPQKTRLVLVGDPNQLPPVGTGEILSSFVNDEKLDDVAREEREFYDNLHRCVKKLTQNYRAKDAPEIVAWQEGIIAGDERAATKAPTPIDSLRFEGAEYCASVYELGAAVNKWVETMKSQYEDERGESLAAGVSRLDFSADGVDEADFEVIRRAFDFFDRGYRVLSTVNDGVFGVESLNRRIMTALGLSNASEFPKGALVMLTANNYRINHFNGDTGIVVVRRTKTGEAESFVAFPKMSASGGRTFEFFPLGMVASTLQSAFAITIHKSQGSEYERGLIVLPPQGSALLSRNLLYTAVSRMRRGVVVLGLRETLEACVKPERQLDPKLPYAPCRGNSQGTLADA